MDSSNLEEAGGRPQRAQREEAWFHFARRQRSPRLLVFCFPHAGGNGMAFRGWAGHFQPDVEVIGVTFPSHWGQIDSPGSRRMSDLVDALLPVMRPLLDRPFMFFGHSMGALVAFESLRALRRSGEAAWATQPAVSACRAPHLPRRRAIHTLPEDEFIQRVVEMGGMPLEMLEDDEVLDLLLPCLRADFELVETWQYREELPLALPIVAYGGVDDAFVSREALEGWRQHTTAAFCSHQLPGNHFYSSSDEPALLNRLSRQSLEP